jgi:hypothetical protein
MKAYAGVDTDYAIPASFICLYVKINQRKC